MANVVINAVILGADSPVGGYLARLLQARGQTVFAVGGHAGGALAALGSLADVNLVDSAEAAALSGRLADATVYLVRQPGDGDTVATMLAAFATAPAALRIAHVVDAAALREAPALLATAKTVAGLRRDHGRHAVNAILHAHDSRLGPITSLAGRVTDAAWRAAKGESVRLELVETGPQDWGWTAEYVDAVGRIAALPAPLDLAVGSGHCLTTAEFVEHAFGFFRIAAADHVHIHAGGAAAEPPAEPPIDTARLKTATGWSATTYGRDLVRALCEGAASRNAAQR